MTSVVQSAETAEQILVVDTGLFRLAKFVGKDVQHQLAVAVGVDMPVGLGIQVLSELVRVDEIAVMGEADTIGAIDVEWLRLYLGACPGGGIPQMAQAHTALENFEHRAVAEDLGDHAFISTHVKSSSRGTRDYARSILTTVCVYLGQRCRCFFSSEKQGQANSKISDGIMRSRKRKTYVEASKALRGARRRQQTTNLPESARGPHT